MSEWPKTLVKTEYEGTVVSGRGIGGDRGSSVKVIPADLGRELYEALKLSTSINNERCPLAREAEEECLEGFCECCDRARPALTRYEQEVGE